MPGTLISFSVSEGDTVEIGQDLCIVEAMKMQNVIKAPRSGVISKLKVAVGASLMSDQILVEYEPEDEPKDGKTET
jgi:propionyl-CoA carboxylase alpha chain